MIEDESVEVFKDLNKGERVLASFLPSHIAYLGAYIAGVVLCLTFILAIIGIPIIIIAFFHRKGNKYYITNQRIIHDLKFISRNTSSVSYSKIQDVHLNQSFIDRMFEIGTVLINTAGSNAIELNIKDIKEPKRIKNLVEKNMHHNSSKKGNDSSDSYSKIEKLHELMKKGIITKKEFEKKKTKLLA